MSGSNVVPLSTITIWSSVDLTPGIRPCHPEYALHKQFCVCTFDLWLSAAFAFCLFPFPLIYTRMHAHHNFGTTATAPYSRNTGS